jgi:hypothetical protein
MNDGQSAPNPTGRFGRLAFKLSFSTLAPPCRGTRGSGLRSCHAHEDNCSRDNEKVTSANLTGSSLFPRSSRAFFFKTNLAYRAPKKKRPQEIGPQAAEVHSMAVPVAWEVMIRPNSVLRRQTVSLVSSLSRSFVLSGRVPIIRRPSSVSGHKAFGRSQDNSMPLPSGSRR